jgi:hypothetical protein
VVGLHGDADIGSWLKVLTDCWQLHHAFARTALFDEEIDKLKGWFGSGSGAFYVNFERHA